MPLKDAYSSYRFIVEMQGLAQVYFTECQGLEVEIEFEEVVEGGLNGYVHRLPKKVSRFPNLVLKRGLASDELWAWHARTVDGFIERKSVSVQLLGYAGMQHVRWNIYGALPIKWTGPSFNSGDSQVAFETLELIHNGIERAAGGQRANRG
jgi:phage tail-like protein